MGRRTVLAEYLVFSVAVLSSVGGCFAIPSQHSSIGSFRGGFHQVDLELKEGASLKVELSFRTASYDSGLLFLAAQRNHSGYLAAGLRDGALEIVLKRNDDGQTPPRVLHSFDFILHNTSTHPSDWHSLSVQYDQSLQLLSVTLDNSIIHSQTLTLGEAFSSVFFSGMDSFLSHRLFHTLPLASFFIGCLANVSVDSMPVVFVPDHQNGIELGCCLIPRMPSWCFQSSHSNLSIPTPLYHNGSLLISFNLEPSASGLVLFTQAEPSQSLQLYLSSHNLSLVILSSQENKTTETLLNCPELPSAREVHLVEITLTSESIRCSIGGSTASDMQLSTELSLMFTDLILGSAFVHGVHHPSFEGCIQHFKLNGAEVTPSLGGNQLIQPPPRWEELTFDLHPLIVDEGDRVRLSEQNVRITFPEEFFADDFTVMYQQDIKRSLHIRLVEGPYQGHLVQGSSGNAVSEFTYNALTSQDNETQIFYQHSEISSGNVTDEIVIKLSVECGGSTAAAHQVLFNGTLEITIIESINIPLEVTQNDAMSIAAGTRRVITSNHLTVISLVSPIHVSSEITFALQSIELVACDGTSCNEESGKLVKTYNPNLPVIYFSQQEIDEGKISFQHYERFGVEPVVIQLLASTNGGSINVTIDVHPYNGRIKYLSPPGTCLFVKEGSTAVVGPKHLNTTTNFQDQDPTVNYDIIVEPMYGYFERFITYHNITPDWHPLTSVAPSTSGSQISDVQHFTQEDVDNGHVRYIHNHSLTQESVQFRLRSSNLTGDVETLCIQIVPTAILLDSHISIVAQLIRVDESGSVQINRGLLTTTSSPTEDAFNEVVSIEQMGIVYILEAVPSHGSLLISQRELGIGDNFTFDEVSSGLLSYEHRGTEDHSDSFRIYAVATTTSTLLIKSPDPSPVVTVNIAVNPINNHLPVLSDNLVPINPPEGGFIVITENHIQVTDEDRPHEVLTIFIRRRGETHIGFFARRDVSDKPVSRFTMRDVRERRVIYQHRLNTSAPLTQNQIVRLDDGLKDHYVRGPIRIEAEPRNLTVEISGSNCLANIDAATPDQLTVSIDYSMFSVMLEDHLGQDGNLVHEIDVFVSPPPRYGQFNNRVRGTRNITTFKLVELEQREIEYQFANQTTTTDSDRFSWEFRYGHSVEGPFPFQICIIPVPIPEIVHVGFASVAFGGMVNLDSSHLLARDNRGGQGMNDSLEYRILVPPQNGTLMKRNTPSIIKFTQTDVNDRRVLYKSRHADTHSTMQDRFTFEVCTTYRCTEPETFVININRNNITVVNTGFEVKEGSMHRITTNELNILAPKDSGGLRFYVDQQPEHGNITLKTGAIVVDKIPFFDLDDVKTGSIFYQNDGNEFLHDSFEFTATAQYPNEVTGSLEPLQFSDMANITILPVNDNPPEIVRSLESYDVVKGGSTNIPGSLLSAHDYDSDMHDDDIVWQLQFNSPWNGYMYLDVDRGSAHAISNWTEGDLRRNRLYYRNERAGSGIDIIFYTLSDGFHTSAGDRDDQQIFLNLQEIIFESTATVNLPLRVTEGESVTITTDYLSYRASNDNSLGDEDFIYTVDIQPNHGSLVFNGTVFQTGMSFSQQSLRTGSLVYIHDHSNNKTDSFQYKLEVVDRTREDRAGNLFEFQIAIDTVDDDPPEVTYIQDPLFVVELSHVQINGSALVIYDLDAGNDVEYDEIVCTLEKHPSYGLLSRDRFGKKTIHTSEFTKLDVERNHLVYNHTTLGHYEDQFTFKVTDGINPQNETYKVNIVILPEEVSVRVSNISVDEGQREYLEREDFVIDHPYLNTVAGQFSVIRHPTSGELRNIITNEKVMHAFTVEDLARKFIVYQHNGNGKEITSDAFEFFYESLQPEGLRRRSSPKTVHINIKPVDDEPPIFGRSENRADIISGSEILLNERYLNVTDGDTPPEQLKYTFTFNIRGYIAYTNDTKQSIQWFTHADVMAGRVKFIHEMDLTGNILFNVTDGKQYALTMLDITTTELEIDCDEERWSEVSVTAGGEVRITNDHINCRILYDVLVPITFVVSGPPQHGNIMVDGEVRNRFTMVEVNENKVTYVHTDFEFWEEEERLNMSAVANYVEPFLCEKLIHIRFPQSNTSSLFAVNEGLQLEEGGVACLNETNLDVRNLRYRAWLANREAVPWPSDLVPVFDVTDGPRNGTLFLLDSPSTPVANFTYTNVHNVSQEVCYQHSDEEKFEDSIHIRLHFVPRENLAASLVFTGNQSYLSGISDIIAINITPVNDQRPIVKTNRNLALVLNFTHRITADDLCVKDLDSPPENVTFTLLSPLPSGANLLLNDQALTIGNNFTQADIFNDRLKIEPVSETTEQQWFNLNYEDEIAVKNKVYIWFNVSGHYLRILRAGEVTYQQNAKRILIGRDNLDTETNGDFRDTVFKVRSGPEIGKLRVGEERAAQQFTQIDINEGRVIYIPPSTDTSGYSDSISLVVTNRNQRKIVNLTFTSLVWGTVREDASINLTSSLSRSLPSDLLKLGPDKPPEIKVIQRPTYGRLEFITEVGEGVGWRGDMFTFHYDDLIRGWVSYRWDYTQRVSGVELIDNFTLLVVAEGMQPGKATVTLKLYPPKDYQPSSTTLPGVVVRTDPPRMPDQAPHTGNDEQGFPLYTLVPILGIFVILLIIIAVIILFCTTQQSRIRKKVNIGIARPPPVSVRRTYPWSVDSHAPPNTQAMAPPNYSFDPTSHSGDESVDNEEHNNSETSSGFSEPSPRHSPVQQRAFSIPVHRSQQLISSQSSANHIAAAAAYGQGTTTPSLAPPRARSRASNVSITFSSRQSMAASDVNIEDSASHFYCHSLPGPQQHGVVVPTPMRPASHSAFSRVPRPLPPMESGYNSEMFPHGAGDSGVLSRAGSCGDYDEDYDLPDFPSADVDVPLPASLNDRLSGSIVVPSCRVDGDAGPGPMELGKSSLAIGEDFLDLNDPNVLQRLRSPNPVLRKEEYWV